MPVREKLKKVLHLDHGGDSGNSSPQDLTGSDPHTTFSSESRHGEASRSADKRMSSGSGQGIASTQATSHGRHPSTSNNGHGTTQTSGQVRRSQDVLDQARKPINGNSGRYSEDIAERNIEAAHKLHDESASPAPLKSASSTSDGSLSASNTKSGVARDGSALSGAVGTAPSLGSGEPHVERKQSSQDLRRRASIDKSIPAPPTNFSIRDIPAAKRDVADSKHVKGKYAVKDAPEAPSLAGVVDLRNTEDTTVDENWAPAVTHEVVNKDIHHIREEEITRDIHTHDVYHRILPIHDVEVLPARHFVPDGKGGLVEISKDEIPGRAGDEQKWQIVETVSKGNVTKEPRRFTAREFPGAEGDYKEYISPEGVPRTETTWVHPPEVEEYGKLSGQTVPFHFGSTDPRDDGLRIYAPQGPVSGSSRMHAEQSRLMTPPEDQMSKMSLNEAVAKPDAAKDEPLTPPQTATSSAFTGEVHDPRLVRASTSEPIDPDLKGWRSWLDEQTQVL